MKIWFLSTEMIRYIVYRKKKLKKQSCGETGDHFYQRDVEINDKDTSKPVARHFNLPNHSYQHLTICGFFLNQGNTESRKNLERKFIFQIGTLNPHGIKERFSFN